jgi:predicted HTH transcriptional regulator
MDTEQLEKLINGQQETDTIEFKAAMQWNRNSLVKDILALANTIDGGTIIIGIEDGTFNRQGVNADMIKSYDIDTMRDQVAPYADPRVVFSCYEVKDFGGLTYIAIEVFSFEEFPVICAKDGPDVAAGTIYYRSRSARPASARVSNSSDLREILEVAIARRSRQLKRMGFAATRQNEYDFDGELAGL